VGCRVMGPVTLLRHPNRKKLPYPLVFIPMHRLYTPQTSGGNRTRVTRKVIIVEQQLERGNDGSVGAGVGGAGGERCRSQGRRNRWGEV
jgi:hypothetical protein